MGGTLTRRQSRGRECFWVVPALQGLFSRRTPVNIGKSCCIWNEGEVVRVVNLIRAGTETAGVGDIGGQRCSHCFTALNRCDPGNLPASEKTFDDPVHIA